jgi:hypothetical protein
MPGLVPGIFRHCERSVAIQLLAVRFLDCFVGFAASQ